MNRQLLIGLLGCLLAVSVTAGTTVPPLINYQGTLTDETGSLPLDGAHNLTFRLYDAASGGTPKWEETHTAPVTGGRFNVILGSIVSTIASAFATGDAYLEIAVDQGVPIAPRQRVVSAPYAFKADQANQATHHSNLIPVGMVAPFMGTTAPEGWLLCNGAAIPADSKYAALKAVVGTKVPDLRGAFMRGLDSGKGLDPGRALGSYQADAFQGHRHRMGYRGGAGVTGTPFGMIAPDYINGTAPDSIQHIQGPISDGTNGTPRTANETRPKNIAVNYIIKY